MSVDLAVAFAAAPLIRSRFQSKCRVCNRSTFQQPVRWKKDLGVAHETCLSSVQQQKNLSLKSEELKPYVEPKLATDWRDR